MCASGCVVECLTCNREVAGSNLGLGYFAPRSTQPSIPPGSVNEFQLRLGTQRQVWLISLADETQGVQVKLCYPLTMRAIPERLRDASCGDAIQIVCLSVCLCVSLSVCLFIVHFYGHLA